MEENTLSRRAFLHMSATAAVAVVVAACSPAEPQVVEREVTKEVVKEVERVVTPTAAPPEAAELLIWDPTFAPQQTLMGELTAQYTGMYPNITFKYDHIKYDEVGKKVMIAMAGGSGPDIFQVPTYEWPRFIENNAILEVDPMSFGVGSLSELEAQFVPNLLNLFKIDGKVHAAPAQTSVYLMLYNPSVFTEGFPETWAELIEASKSITKEEGGAYTAVTLTLGIASAENILAGLGPFIWANGGDFLSQDGTKCALTEPKAVEGVAMMRSLIDEKVWVPDFPGTAEMRVAGSVAASPGGDWSLPSLDAMSEEAGGTKLQLAPFPVYNKGDKPSGFITAWAYLVNAASKHPQEAWKAISYFLNAENSKRWTEQCGMYNGRLASWVIELERQDPRLKVAHDQLSNGEIGIMSAKFNEMMEPIIEGTQAIMLENAPMESTLGDICSKVDSVLAG